MHVTRGTSARLNPTVSLRCPEVICELTESLCTWYNKQKEGPAPPSRRRDPRSGRMPSRKQQKEVARHPVDVGFATTEAKRRTRTAQQKEGPDFRHFKEES